MPAPASDNGDSVYFSTQKRSHLHLLWVPSSGPVEAGACHILIKPPLRVQSQPPPLLARCCSILLCGDCGTPSGGTCILCHQSAGGVLGLELFGLLPAGFPGAGTPGVLFAARSATTSDGKRSMARYGKRGKGKKVSLFYHLGYHVVSVRYMYVMLLYVLSATVSLFILLSPSLDARTQTATVAYSCFATCVRRLCLRFPRHVIFGL